MDIKVENLGQNGISEPQKPPLQAASTINMIANKLANSKAQPAQAQQPSASEISLALTQQPLTVATKFTSQPTTELAFITSQATTGAIAMPTQNQITLLTSQPADVGTAANQPPNNSVVSKMTELLSLKQSPMLRKQQTTPISGTTNKVQVITTYMCRYCGKQFNSPSDMEIHIQNHVNGRTPHTCSICGKEYKGRLKLQRHVRVHSGERPYACTLCGRRFTSSHSVKKHMKTHLQARPFTGHLPQVKVKHQNICRLCNDMKFNRRQTLHLHLQQQHVIQQVYACHQCGEIYESLEELQSHKLTHDAVLNSLKDGGMRSLNPSLGVAKFALGPQKVETFNKLEPVLSEKDRTRDSEQSRKISILDKISANGLYIPAIFDHVMTPSSKFVLEGTTKETIKLEIQKKWQQDLVEDTKKAQESEEEKQRIKIAHCFRVNPDGTCTSINNKPTDVEMEKEEDCYKQATTFVSEDGMSMFLPNNTEDTDFEIKAVDDDDDDDDETQ